MFVNNIGCPNSKLAIDYIAVSLCNQ